MDRNFKDATSTQIAKASSEYKKDQTQEPQKKAQEVTAAKGSNPKNSSASKEETKICYGCGTQIRDIEGLFLCHRKKECSGRDKKCNRCSKQGYSAKFCPFPRSQETIRASSASFTRAWGNCLAWPNLPSTGRTSPKSSRRGALPKRKNLTPKKVQEKAH